MSRLATKRIQNELAAMQNDPPPGCVLSEMGDDIFRWNVEIQGPPDSPYEGGTYALLVTFPRDYPFKPPTVKFETRIFHPNINMNGDICLDTLSSQWAAGISMAQVLLSITALLSDPNPSDPINLEAARVLRNDPDTYNRMVRGMVARQRDFSPGERAVVGGGRRVGGVRRVSGVRRVGGVRRVSGVRRLGRGSVDNRAGEMENQQSEDVAEGGDDEGEGEAGDDGVAGEAVDDGVNNEEGDLDGQGPDGRRVGQGRDEEEGEREDLAQQGNGQEELAQEGAGDLEEDSSEEGDGVDDLAPEGDAGEDNDENGEEDFAQGEHE